MLMKEYQSMMNLHHLQLKFWLQLAFMREKIFCLKTHIELKESYKDIVTIIVRHINRVNRIKSISETLNLKLRFK